MDGNVFYLSLNAWPSSAHTACNAAGHSLARNIRMQELSS